MTRAPRSLTPSRSTPGADIAKAADTGESAQNGSLVHQVMQAISDHIQQHALRVGDTLPAESEFAAQVGVSRAVIREAFGAMAALKLIDVGNGRKARVGALDGSVIAVSLKHALTTAQITVHEVWDVRRTIEVRTAMLAAASRTEGEAAEISTLAEAMLQDRFDQSLAVQHDISFHQAIARATRNLLFVQIVSSFAPIMEIAITASWVTHTSERARMTMIRRHRNVADAICRKDPEAAHAAMDAHFDATLGRSLHALAALAAPRPS
jgi:GntR family transcriptional repressor for pyruvate dehydrogenase complex